MPHHCPDRTQDPAYHMLTSRRMLNGRCVNSTQDSEHDAGTAYTGPIQIRLEDDSLQPSSQPWHTTSSRNRCGRLRAVLCCASSHENRVKSPVSGFQEHSTSSGNMARLNSSCQSIMRSVSVCLKSGNIAVDRLTAMPVALRPVASDKKKEKIVNSDRCPPTSV